MTSTAGSLDSFLDHDADEWSLAVVNRTRPQPIQSLLEGLFADQPVTVEERTLPDTDDDLVLLLRDGEVVASSPLKALEDTILLVNSDLYVTGTKSLGEIDPPDVITELEDTTFHLRGYPESNTEKLPLIIISRYIEQLAWEHGEGTLRASFQHLSRIRDERGTRNVYERLAGSDVDVHVYGLPDWLPPSTFQGTIHAGYQGEFKQAWFVVHWTPDDDGEVAALVALQRDTNEWDGFWTFDEGTVSEINRYLERNL